MSDVKTIVANTRLVLVCQECGQRKEVDSSESLPASEVIARHLENLSGTGHSIQVVRTGCLDFCPKDKVTLAVSRVSDRGEPETLFAFVDTTCDLTRVVSS